jgi:hypothetical protein
MHFKNRTAAPALPPSHRHEWTDSEYNAAVDVAIDIFEESHGLAVLLQTDFAALTRKIEGLMMIVDSDELCLADRETRRIIIAQRLGLRRRDALGKKFLFGRRNLHSCGSSFDLLLPLCITITISASMLTDT